MLGSIRYVQACPYAAPCDAIRKIAGFHQCLERAGHAIGQEMKYVPAVPSSHKWFVRSQSEACPASCMAESAHGIRDVDQDRWRIYPVRTAAQARSVQTPCHNSSQSEHDLPPVCRPTADTHIIARGGAAVGCQFKLTTAAVLLATRQQAKARHLASALEFAVSAI